MLKQDVNGPDQKMKYLGDELFKLLSDVTNTIDGNINKRTGNNIEIQALNAIKYYGKEIFQYAFNVFYATWDGRAHYLIQLMDDIIKDQVLDISFKKVYLLKIYISKTF